MGHISDIKQMNLEEVTEVLAEIAEAADWHLAPEGFIKARIESPRWDLCTPYGMRVASSAAARRYRELTGIKPPPKDDTIRVSLDRGYPLNRSQREAIEDYDRSKADPYDEAHGLDHK